MEKIAPLKGPLQAEGRTERKRRAILAAATTLFLRQGFGGTSMDQVAGAAGVSKQTVYKQFNDKQSLFRHIVEGVGQNSEVIVEQIREAFGEIPAGTPAELELRLGRVANCYLGAVLQSRVMSLRRLIIAEVEQFPDLARSYFNTAPAKGMEVIEDCLRPYVDSGLLATDDLGMAAAQFAHLSLSIAQDRALFIPEALPDEAERDRLAVAAARTFMAAFGPR